MTYSDALKSIETLQSVNSRSKELDIPSQITQFNALQKLQENAPRGTFPAIDKLLSLSTSRLNASISLLILFNKNIEEDLRYIVADSE